MTRYSEPSPVYTYAAVLERDDLIVISSEEITEEQHTRRKKRGTALQQTIPVAIVGFAVAAALMVLLLLTQSQLSQISFEISALEQELNELEIEQEKLRISHAEIYDLRRVEEYAVNVLGMIRPNPDQIHYIDTADDSRTEPEITPAP
ncbi:MAG: cell division protein FtsL [Oscillospiraceae bacterium]|nr:cell division protein FtsL [Oscillospiraceae bacterium]